MSTYAPQPDEIDEWRQIVRRDLADSVSLLELERVDNAAYLAQQAAEKLLKLMLIEVGVEPPRTHNLRRLAGLLPVGSDVPLPERLLKSAQLWAVDVRYPGRNAPDPIHDEIAEVQAALTAYLAKRGW